MASTNKLTYKDNHIKNYTPINTTIDFNKIVDAYKLKSKGLNILKNNNNY